jgi:hypothetical protein
MIMKVNITIIVLFFVELGFAQLTMEKSSIDSGGGISSSGTIEMVSTIGEMAIQEATSSNFHISEGFINPDILNSLGVTTYGVLTQVSVYPNPTVDFVHIEFENSGTYEIVLTDLNGRQLFQQAKQASNFQVDLSKYEGAAYLLMVKNKTTRNYNIFKIIKQ